jgi:hypothetical protein
MILNIIGHSLEAIAIPFVSIPIITMFFASKKIAELSASKHIPKEVSKSVIYHMRYHTIWPSRFEIYFIVFGLFLQMIGAIILVYAEIIG